MSRIFLLAVLAFFVASTHALCGEADKEIWKQINATYSWTNSRCSTQCHDQSSCVANCVSHALGFTHECSNSIGELAACTRDACKGSRKRCTLCKCSVEANCLTKFGTSSGLSLVNTPFASKVGN